MTTERTEFGRFLQRAREARGLTRAQLSRTTKIQEGLIEHLEGGRFELLPAAVFVEGFVKAMARECAFDSGDALARLRHCMAPPIEVVEVAPPPMAPAPVAPADVYDPRRKMGVALVVLLVLIMATVTLSLLLGSGTTPLQPLS